MKAKIRPPKIEKSVLLYNVDSAEISPILEEVGAKAIFISREDFKKSLSLLFSEEGKAPNVNDGDESCLVMGGFERTDIDLLVLLLRKNKVDISLKAVTTPFNINWSFEKLMNELKNERAAIKRQTNK